MNHLPERIFAPVVCGPEVYCDSRFRCIIVTLGRLSTAVAKYDSLNLTGELDRLLDAVITQISAENSFIDLVAFPGAPQHRVRHQVICTHTARLCRRARKEAGFWVLELNFLLLVWLEHIQLHDRALERFVSQNHSNADA